MLFKTNKTSLHFSLFLFSLIIHPLLSLAANQECLANLENPPYRIQTVSEYLSSWHDEEARFFRDSTGKNFDSVFRSAAKNNLNSLSMLFKSSPSYDGAGAEGFASALLVLMVNLGDAHFSKALKHQPSSIKQKVIDYIDYATPYDYSSSHPKTYALGKHPPKCTD